MEKVKNRYQAMVLLSAHKLGMAYGERKLFQDISFDISEKERIGFIGANGVGKTTLLRVLSGEETATNGEVHQSRQLGIGVLEQTPALLPGETVLDLALRGFHPLMRIERELQAVAAAMDKHGAPLDTLIKKQHALQERYQDGGGLTYRSRTRAVLRGLGFSDEYMTLSAHALSGGQLNKVMLASLLIREASLLLLDEPTNHLDNAAVEWLEAYLNDYKGAFVVISHDRYFLDRVTNKTFELTPNGFFVSEGGYTRHIERRLSEQEFIRRKYNNTQKEIRRIYGIVEQQRRWNRQRNIKTAESRLKQIERLKATLIEPERQSEAVHFTFRGKAVGGNDVLLAGHVKKAYGEHALFHDVSLHIRRGERVFLLGPNGCGKTTLLKILAGKEVADAGAHMLGAGVKLACYEQNMRFAHEENTVLQDVWDAYPKLSRTQAHNALAAFLFKGGDVNKQISMLSGGERARVQLLKLMLSGANLLLLDEPTNHLDIASREALETALEEFDGALLMVTHDRYLVNRLADRVLYMSDAGIIETMGGYDAYMGALASAAPMEQGAQPSGGDRPQNDYLAKKERRAELAQLRGVVSSLERQIARNEEEIDAVEKRLMQPEALEDYKKAAELSTSLGRLKQEIAKLYESWERAASQAEKLRAED
ncbi:MAG: ABC-F family ATP-binding cassette domain-containing protein [Clostridiales bacterium]|jgi:ATP-binding cassette subfamily F protein 3|nr:ABC-F family ATP-binding cassette domain-containing protein [Clostridiales bacterium]